jgi:hypothetical protein
MNWYVICHGEIKTLFEEIETLFSFSHHMACYKKLSPFSVGPGSDSGPLKKRFEVTVTCFLFHFYIHRFLSSSFIFLVFNCLAFFKII